MSIKENLELFTCMFYGAKDTTSVNKAIYEMFRMGKFSDAASPPNKDCLLQHIQRASYQAAIWKRAATAIIDTPSPTDHGWKIDEEGNIDAVWMTKKCAPDVLLKDCNCKCKTGCSTLRCSCKKANNQCNEMCQCVRCTNCHHESKESGSLDEYDSDDLGSDIEEETYTSILRFLIQTFSEQLFMSVGN